MRALSFRRASEVFEASDSHGQSGLFRVVGILRYAAEVARGILRYAFAVSCDVFQSARALSMNSSVQ